MRQTLMVAGLILLPTLVQAQEIGIKRIMAADTQNGSVTANLNYWKAVEDNQKRWVELKDERELWLGRNQIYENVISLRSKDSIQKALDEQRTKLGVADPKVGFAYDPNAPKNVGYYRMGESNPYDNTSYLRYYDEKGQLKISEVRGLKADLERQSADIEKHRQRLIQSGQEVEDKYSTAIDAYNKADMARQDFDKAATDLAAAQDRYQREQASVDTAGGGDVSGNTGGGGNASGAPYKLKYPSRVGGAMRVQIEGSYQTLDQAMAAGRQLQSTTSFNVIVIDSSGNSVGDP
jgi:hypothetical protein